MVNNNHKLLPSLAGDALNLIILDWSGTVWQYRFNYFICEKEQWIPFWHNPNTGKPLFGNTQESFMDLLDGINKSNEMTEITILYFISSLEIL